MSFRPVLVEEAGPPICEALGLDATSVNRLELVLDPSEDFAILNVELMVDEARTSGLVGVLRRYSLMTEAT